LLIVGAGAKTIARRWLPIDGPVHGGMRSVRTFQGDKITSTTGNKKSFSYLLPPEINTPTLLQAYAVHFFF
jgi:hypothetical protein